MKKLSCTFALSSLLTLNLMMPNAANAESLFVGLEHYSGETEITRDTDLSLEKEFDQDISGFRVKFGGEEGEHLRFQGFLKFEDLEDDIPFLASDGKIFGIGGELMLMLPVQPSFKPYVSAGVSADFAELDDEGVYYSEDIIRAIAFKAGVGVLLKVTDQLEIQLGYDMQYRTWQDIEVEFPTKYDLEQEDSSQNFALGVNVFF